MATTQPTHSSDNLVANADAFDPSLTATFANLSIPDGDNELVESLIHISANSPKLIKSSTYQAPADPKIKIKSWKMNEFKYYDIPSPFPTLARGLFTQEIKTASGQTKNRIVARGYDKFFNIGEVPWTTVSALVRIVLLSATLPVRVLRLLSTQCMSYLFPPVMHVWDQRTRWQVLTVSRFAIE